MLNRKIERRYDEKHTKFTSPSDPILKELAKLIGLKQSRVIGKEEFERLTSNIILYGVKRKNRYMLISSVSMWGLR
jgi:hypothetical protein